MLEFKGPWLNIRKKHTVIYPLRSVTVLSRVTAYEKPEHTVCFHDVQALTCACAGDVILCQDQWQEAGYCLICSCLE